MWCDAQRRGVERCDAPRRVALPTVMSISPTHLIDCAKTWRGREAPSRQRCCRIVIMFVSDSIRSPSLPSLPTIMPRPAKPSSPTPAHSTRIRIAKEEVKVSEAKIDDRPSADEIHNRLSWMLARCCRQRCLAQGRDEKCGASVFFAHTRFIQEGGLCYSAPLGFSARLHKEIDVAATSRSRHESDPSPFAVLTGRGLLGSAQARAA
jgi:hypothetical protein